MAKLISFFLLLILPIFGQDTPAIPEPTQVDNSRFMAEFFKMFLVLGGMVIVLYFISWYVKKLNATRFEKGNDVALIKVVERRAIAPRVNIYLIDVEGHSLLVGETPHGLVRLLDYPAEK